MRARGNAARPRGPPGFPVVRGRRSSHTAVPEGSGGGAGGEKMGVQTNTHGAH